MARRTHYDVLGVSKDASSVDIAAAFRDRLADLKAKGAAEEAAAVREAYQVLASPDRRAEYDQEQAARMPASARRAAQTATPAARSLADDEGSGKPWLKYAIPALTVIVVIVGWKVSHKPKPPEAHVVSVQRFDEPPPETSPPRQDRGVQAAARVASPAPPESMSPEQLFAAVSPSIVRVHAGESRQGSGVVIDSGVVITNCHVTGGAGNVKVKSGTDMLPATVTVADESLDLCSLKVSRLDAPAVSMGTVEKLKTGQRVYAIGAPMGLELTISEGIVSALREVENGKVIQTTAPVSPGSSGGGLFTADGQLVGIVTFQHRFGQNLNFALPADWIADMRDRKGGPAYAAARAAPTPTASAEDENPAELVVGSWHCFGSLSGRNGTYTYGSDGMMRIVSTDGRDITAPYRVVGRNIRYALQGQVFAFEIESISRERMVQFVESGQRLACERN